MIKNKVLIYVIETAEPKISADLFPGKIAQLRLPVELEEPVRHFCLEAAKHAGQQVLPGDPVRHWLPLRGPAQSRLGAGCPANLLMIGHRRLLWCSGSCQAALLWART